MTPGLVGSTIVWFREGFEIWLILQMAWLMVQNQKQKIVLFSSTAIGVLVALTLGAFAKDFVEQDFEFVEAITAIFASFLLFWTAWYCHSAQKNVEIIKDNLKNNGSILALAIVVFLTVIREGAEIVVFLSGLYVAGSTFLDIGLGAFAGLGLLLVVAIYAAKKLRKIPVAKIFGSSKW